MAWSEDTANVLAAAIHHLPAAGYRLRQAHTKILTVEKIEAWNEVVTLDNLIKAKEHLLAVLRPLEIAQAAIMRSQEERAKLPA